MTNEHIEARLFILETAKKAMLLNLSRYESKVNKQSDKLFQKDGSNSTLKGRAKERSTLSILCEERDRWQFRIEEIERWKAEIKDNKKDAN